MQSKKMCGHSTEGSARIVEVQMVEARVVEVRIVEARIVGLGIANSEARIVEA